MSNLIPIEPSKPNIKKYDLFITKVNEHKIIQEYSAYEERYNMSIESVAHFKIECEQLLDYANNYKLVDNQLIELTEEEKPKPQAAKPTETEKFKIRVEQTEQALGLLATQLAKNTLLQNQGGATV